MPSNERFRWAVRYDDGSWLNEYDDSGHHSFNDVEIGRVVVLMVESVEEGGPVYVVHCNPSAGIRPIMFRTVAMNATTGETARWHVFGTQQTVKGVNVKCLHYLDEQTGDITISDRPLEVM